MRVFKRALGLIFLALLAVYFGHAITGRAAAAVSSGDYQGQQAAQDVFSSTQPVEQTINPQQVPPPKITASEGGTFSIQINNDVPLVEVLRMVGSQAQVSIIPS